MGAYLSKPIRDKESCDESLEQLTYGASSMQGWRGTQEDAHNCCPKFDEETPTSLFAVYDGHGGSEVAQYTAIHFPEFLRKQEEYRDGRLADALEAAFIGFDAHLTEGHVLHELKELAGVTEDEETAEGKGGGKEAEVADLVEEGTMPLEQLLERYGYPTAAKKPLLGLSEKFHSPAIRAKSSDQNAADSSDAAACKDTGSVAIKLDSVLLNGHSENDNNANLEKERGGMSSTSSSTSAQESTIDSTTTDSNNGVLQQTEAVVSTKDSEAEAVVESSAATSTSTSNTDGKAPCSSSSASAEPTAAGGSTSSSAGGEPSSSSSTSAGSSSSQAAEAGPGPSSSGEGPSTSGGAGPSSSSSKTDDCQPGSSSGGAPGSSSGGAPGSDDDSEEEWDTDEEEEMDGFPGSGDDDDEDDDDDDGEEDDDDDDVPLGGEEPGSDSGCTAVVALLRGRHLYVANAGDSRCVVSRGGKALDMSVDHKPEDDIERKRIEAAGGKVTLDGRVNGGLNLSRALGDHCYKQNADLPARDQMITALPDVRCVTLEDTDHFMVLACDGIWNTMSSQDVVDFVSQRMAQGVTTMSTICEDMFEFCLAPDTSGDGTGCDNMTAIIVNFTNLNNNVAVGKATKRPASQITTDAQDDDDVVRSQPEAKKLKTNGHDEEGTHNNEVKDESAAAAAENNELAKNAAESDTPASGVPTETETQSS